LDVTIQPLVKLVFIGALDLNVTFLCTFLSPAKEKYQKKRCSRGNLRFPLKIPSLTWWRTRCSCTALIAPKVIYAKIAELLTAVNQLGRAENARVGKVFAPREGKL
jgi:hypothetical protein